MKLLEINIDRSDRVSVETDFDTIDVNDVQHAVMHHAINAVKKARALGPKAYKGFCFLVYYLILAVMVENNAGDDVPDFRDQVRDFRKLYDKLQ